MIRRLLLAFAFCLVTLPAYAATCFWVGGAGTWDNSTDAAHWSSGTGGAGSTCAATGGVPKNAADTATFDGSSGGGTVTVAVDISITQITAGAFTGTLDFSVNNNNVTLSTAFRMDGSGTRTLKCGTATFNYTNSSGSQTVFNLSTVTNLTTTCGSETHNITATNFTGQRIFSGGGKSLGTLNIAGGSVSLTGGGLGVTLATLTIAPPAHVIFGTGVTTTITNAFNFAGTSSTNAIILDGGGSGSQATVSVASGSPTMNWAALMAMAFTGGATFTATNSIDGQRNSGITISAPSGGAASGRIIGGWLLKRDLRPDNDNTPAFLANAA